MIYSISDVNMLNKFFNDTVFLLKKEIINILLTGKKIENYEIQVDKLCVVKCQKSTCS